MSACALTAWPTQFLRVHPLRAALVRLDQVDGASWSSVFELGVRAYGTGGLEPAERLVSAVRGWHAGGRLETAGIRIRAYSRTSNIDDDTVAVIDKHYCRLHLDWHPGRSSD